MSGRLLSVPKVPDGIGMPMHNFLQAVKNQLEALGGTLDANQIRPSAQDLIDRGIIDQWPPITILMAPKVEAGSFTRDVSITTTYEVKGLTFRPKLVLVLAVIASTTAASWGFATRTLDQAVYDAHQITVDEYESSGGAIALNTGAGPDTLTGSIAMTSAGFKIFWTKAGAPTGTATINWVAIG